MAIFYFDPVNGNDANNATSFALRKKTLSAITTATANDEMRIIQSPDPTSLSQNATWTKFSKTITLTTAVTANICTCETAWTASANVTSTADATQFKEGTKSAKHVVAAGFTTGKIAYFDIGSSTDFSAYQQVSMWIFPNVATAAAGNLQLWLCSDTVGDVSVNVINIPQISTTNAWVPIVIDYGGALGSNIRSISIVAPSVDPGSLTVYLDNIIACKASASDDSLTLVSLIGKNTAGETWHGIQSINGTTVMIDNGVMVLGSAGRGYYGNTETVTTWKRECLKRVIITSSDWDSISGSSVGTSAGRITVSGGWNSTDMSTKVGMTFYDSQTGQGIGFNTGNGGSLRTISDIGVVRSGGFVINGPMNDLNNIHVIACGFNTNYVAMTFSYNNHSSNCRMYNSYIVNTHGHGWQNLQGSIYASGISVNSNLSQGVINAGYSTNSTYVDFQVNNNSVGILSYGNTVFYHLSTSGNVTGVSCGNRNSSGSTLYLVDSDMKDTTPMDAFLSYADYQVATKNLNNSNRNEIFTDNGYIQSESGTNRHTDSGIAWGFYPTSTLRSAVYPLKKKIANVVCQSGIDVNIYAWANRSSTSLDLGLYCPAGQIGGPATDQTTLVASGALVWQQISVGWTPYRDGVVDVYGIAYGGTSHSGIIDDLSVTSARSYTTMYGMDVDKFGEPYVTLAGIPTRSF